VIKFFPARESLVSDIPAGNGKTDNLFLQCTGTQYTIYLTPFPGMEVSHIKYRYWISAFSLLVHPFIPYCAYNISPAQRNRQHFVTTPNQVNYHHQTIFFLESNQPRAVFF